MTIELEPAGTTKSQPHNLVAEQIVLGAMMLDRNAIGDITEIVKPDDYYRPIHSTIHRAVLALYGRGEPTDAAAVTTQLLENGDLTRTGGAAYLHTCINQVPTAANGTWYAREIIETAGRRRLAAVGNKMIQLAYDPEVELAQAVDQAGAAFYDATAHHETGDLEPASSLISDALQAIEDAGKRGTGMQGLSTGFVDLDQLLNGLKGGQLIVVAGRPGMGKSVFAGDVARVNALHDSKSVAIFNLEMKKNEVINRLLAADGRVPLNLVKSGALTDDDWNRLTPAVERFATAGLFIDDSANLTMTEIRSRARRVAQRGDLDLVIVDYLQLMTPSGRRVDNRQQEVAEISRGLKMLAKELDIPVIAVAQLNRGVEQRQDKRPMLSDLRESGALEQDADIVILLHRDDYYDKESPRSGEADIIVAKHRDGGTDTITVAAQLHFSRFTDMAIA